MPLIDWSTEEQRKQFEKDLNDHRGIKKTYSWIQWLLWFSGVIILPAMLVLCFYGPVAYTIVNDQRNIDSEQQSRKIDRYTSDNFTNNSHVGYNDPMLYAIKRNFYFVTVTCQGMAFILCVAFHYTNYKWWSFLGGVIAMLCLPVDVLILYLDPLGLVGTFIAMVLGFVPFVITIADAVYVEKEVRIQSLNNMTFTLQKNSWTRHLSLSYNERYQLILRMTGAGYIFFSTVALLIQLFPGDFFPFHMHNV